MATESDIRKLRAEIDEIDSAIITLLGRRRDVALDIAKIKQEIGSEDDEQRLVKVLSNVEKKAEKLGLDGERIKEIWKEVVKYMIEEQMEKFPY